MGNSCYLFTAFILSDTVKLSIFHAFTISFTSPQKGKLCRLKYQKNISSIAKM